MLARWKGDEVPPQRDHLGGPGWATTLLNTLSSFIQHDHRVITIEDAAELQLQQHVVRLGDARPTSRAEGRATDLVKNALRMRPDRVIIGECRGPRRST